VLHPFSSEVQQAIEMVDKRPLHKEGYESGSEVEGKSFDSSSQIRKNIRSLIKLIETPIYSKQERQKYFYQFRLSLKKLSSIKSERKVKKFLQQTFDWMRIRAW
jgi:hypothetical protein